jgi:hypothetical protein
MFARAYFAAILQALRHLERDSTRGGIAKMQIRADHRPCLAESRAGYTASLPLSRNLQAAFALFGMGLSWKHPAIIALIVAIVVIAALAASLKWPTERKSAPPGTTFNTARTSGATVTPTEPPSAIQVPVTPRPAGDQR